MALRDGRAPGPRAHQVVPAALALFGVADTRKRELYCAGGCAHAWHNLPSGRGAAS
ncbi:DUF5958 family protein [Streptomyces murinus]|uniref:DUF5958 family protein n=1 Tax=Streptomyces murinus TaxID=33900 RepID=UPI003641A889